MPEQTTGENPATNPESQPPPAPVEPTIEHRVMALEAEQDSHKNGQDPNDLAAAVKTGERWLIGINGLALLVSIGIGIVYIFQLREMRKSTDAATSAACLAQQSLKLTRQMFEASQAAVFVSVYEMKTKPAHYPVWITVSMRNLGKTRATNVQGTIKLIRKTATGKVVQENERGFTRSVIAADDGVTEAIGVNGIWDDLLKFMHEDFRVTVELTFDDGVQRTKQLFCKGPVNQGPDTEVTSFAFEDCENIKTRKQYGY
jgi:hypothetical protein